MKETVWYLGDRVMIPNGMVGFITSIYGDGTYGVELDDVIMSSESLTRIDHETT